MNRTIRLLSETGPHKPLVSGSNSLAATFVLFALRKFVYIGLSCLPPSPPPGIPFCFCIQSGPPPFPSVAPPEC